MRKWYCPDCFSRRETDDSLVVYQCGCGSYYEEEDKYQEGNENG